MKSREDLEAENIELRERLKALTGDDDLWMRLRAEFGVTHRHAQVLALLKGATRALTVSTIYDQVFVRDNGDGPTIDSVKVAVSTVRSALRKRGAPDGIVTIWGQTAYAMTSDLKAWIEARLSARAVAA